MGTARTVASTPLADAMVVVAALAASVAAVSGTNAVVMDSAVETAAETRRRSDAAEVNVLNRSEVDGIELGAVSFAVAVVFATVWHHVPFTPRGHQQRAWAEIDPVTFVPGASVVVFREAELRSIVTHVPPC